MLKIGRNDPCPCGSGRKFKKCCYGKTQEARAAVASSPPQLSLKAEVEKIQQSALTGKSEVRTIGVFVLFSTAGGDAWLLELTAMDALLLSQGGVAREVEIVESPETLEINWSHQFAVRHKQLVVTSYADKAEIVLSGCPTHSIWSAIKKIHQRFPAEVLERIHLEVPADEAPEAAAVAE